MFPKIEPSSFTIETGWKAWNEGEWKIGYDYSSICYLENRLAHEVVDQVYCKIFPAVIFTRPSNRLSGKPSKAPVP